MTSVGTIALLGAVIGVIFGYVGSKTNFCTMGAVADIVNMGDWTRMRMWVCALGVAVLLTGAMQLTGVIDVMPSIYSGKKLRWLSHLVGGLVFGVGMTLAGGCANKQLLRAGAGNMRGVVVFMFLAFSAAMTMTGLFGVWRAQFLDPVAVDLPGAQLMPHLLSGASGMSVTAAWLLGMVVFGLAPVVWALMSHEFRKTEPLMAGIVLGALVAAGWYVTGHLGFIAEHPDTLEPAYLGTSGNRPESLSYVAPYAQAITLFTLWSDAKSFVSFSVASMWGVVLGAFIYAMLHKAVRVEIFRDNNDFFRHVIGAMLMGFGGVTALGCTVGQGITGMSTLSVGSLLTMIGIIAGSAATVKIEYMRA